MGTMTVTTPEIVRGGDRLAVMVDGKFVGSLTRLFHFTKACDHRGRSLGSFETAQTAIDAVVSAFEQRLNR